MRQFFRGNLPFLKGVRSFVQPRTLASFAIQEKFPEELPDLRKDTWNRVFYSLSSRFNIDGRKNSSAIFANSVFPHIDSVSATRISGIFLAPEADQKNPKTDSEITTIINQQLEECGQKEQMQGLLRYVGQSCLRFYNSDDSQDKLTSAYGPVAGDEDIRKKLVHLLNLKYPQEKPIDIDDIIILNSFKQAKYYAEKIGGQAFGLDNNFISCGFIICQNAEHRSEIRRVFNLAMVSASVIHQLALIYYLENDLELAGHQTKHNPKFKEGVKFMKGKIVKDLSTIYQTDFDPSKVFFGNGAQNFVDRLSAFLKVSGYKNVLILASPYHLYPATIKQNGLNPVMMPVTDDLRATPKFLELALNEKYQEWLKDDERDPKFKIAILLNEPENPSGHKHSSADARRIAEVINGFSDRPDAEITYITDGAYKVLYGKGEKYIQDYLNKKKIKVIGFESHSKSNWTFARLSFCIFYFAIENAEGLKILQDNEPQTLTYYILSLVAMSSRTMRAKDTPDYVEEIIGHMNQLLPAKLTHIEGEVYPFIFPKFPEHISEIAPSSNPEFRTKIIKTIFSAKFSNAQLAQIFNLEAEELENGELKNILENFRQQKFVEKEVNFLIDRMIQKENSFEDRVSVLCDSIAPKSNSKEAEKSAYEVIFKLKKLGKLDTEKSEAALLNIKKMMEDLGVDFDDDCNLKDELSKTNLLNKIEKELHKKDFPLGYINCRNTLFSSFALIAYNGLCIANIGIGNNGRIVPRPAFGGLRKEEVTERMSLLEGFLEYVVENKKENKRPSSSVKMLRERESVALDVEQEFCQR